MPPSEKVMNDARVLFMVWISANEGEIPDVEMTRASKKKEWTGRNQSQVDVDKFDDGAAILSPLSLFLSLFSR